MCSLLDMSNDALLGKLLMSCVTTSDWTRVHLMENDASLSAFDSYCGLKKLLIGKLMVAREMSG